MERIKIILVGFIVLSIISCKKEIYKGDVDPSQMPAYWGTAEVSKIPVPEGARAIIGMDTSMGGYGRDLYAGQIFYITDNFHLDSFKLFNELGNLINPYIAKISINKFNRLDKFSFSYEVYSDGGYSYKPYPKSYLKVVRKESNTPSEIWDFPSYLGNKSGYDDVNYIGERKCNISNNRNISCEDFAISGHTPYGAKMDYYGNVIYSSLGDYHYIKNSGGLLELSVQPNSIITGVDGDFYLNLDGNLTLHINGENFKVDSLDKSSDYIPYMGFYFKNLNQWLTSYGMSDTGVKTMTPIPGYATLGDARGLEVSENDVYYLEEIGLGKNRLLKIDPISGVQTNIAPNYDVIHFIVNEDGGGVFTGLSYTDATNYLCSFDANGNINQLFSYQGEFVKLVNLRY